MAEDPASICAVVPAAGRGTRLGLNMPKVFVPLSASFTIWDSLHEKLAQVVNRTVLILSPDGSRYLEEHRREFASESFSKTEVALQPEPQGMGDAIFGAASFWEQAGSLLIVWGDQFNVSPGTLRACVELYASADGPAVVLPVVRLRQPYVEYCFDAGERLVAVRQSREGDKCEPNGYADIGVFFLTGGSVLRREWKKFCASGGRGVATGEINFLPFLVHLSSKAGWPVVRYEGCHPEEALGINTPEELANARRILSEES